ncbi:MAG: DUF2399 domain-containing protein [Anaerolineales bacterium]|nr:DUF2399 domain-containing protein [Anaerolineales bacterium]
MPPTLAPLARDLLNTLLDRHERPNRQTVTRVVLDPERHAAYFDNHEVRQAVEASLQPLVAQGVIVVHRVRRQEHLIDRLDLVPDQAPALYALLRRTPRVEAEAQLADLLDAQAPRAEWQAAFVRHCQAQLAARKSVGPLVLNDGEYNRALLAALDGLARLEEPTLERVFSVRALGESKRFADLRGDVLRVLRKFSPHAGALGDDDKALLAAHYLESVPEYVQMAGALTLRVEGQLCGCAPFAPSLALPASLLRPATIEACGATHIVTIENTTSFEEFCRLRPASVLAVFSGGFASPTVIQLLQRLRIFRPDVTLHHWGDLDVGGLRILRHLRQQVGAVRPILMDAATLAANLARALPLVQAERTALEGLRSDPLLADCEPLIAELLQADQKLEQEALPGAQALAALASPV